MPLTARRYSLPAAEDGRPKKTYPAGGDDKDEGPRGADGPAPGARGADMVGTLVVHVLRAERFIAGVGERDGELVIRRTCSSVSMPCMEIEVVPIGVGRVDAGPGYS